MQLHELLHMSNYGRGYQRAHQQLLDRGWLPSTVPNEYRHPEAPGYSIDLALGHQGKGPFFVFRHDRKIAQVAVPPYATHLMAGDLMRQHRNN